MLPHSYSCMHTYCSTCCTLFHACPSNVPLHHQPTHTRFMLAVPHIMDHSSHSMHHLTMYTMFCSVHAQSHNHHLHIFTYQTHPPFFLHVSYVLSCTTPHTLFLASAHLSCATSIYVSSCTTPCFHAIHGYRTSHVMHCPYTRIQHFLFMHILQTIAALLKGVHPAPYAAHDAIPLITAHTILNNSRAHNHHLAHIADPFTHTASCRSFVHHTPCIQHLICEIQAFRTLTLMCHSHFIAYCILHITARPLSLSVHHFLDHTYHFLNIEVAIP